MPRSSIQALSFFPVTPREENPLLPEGTASSHHSKVSVPVAQKAQQDSDTQSLLPGNLFSCWSREQVWWLCQFPITGQGSVQSIADITQISIICHSKVLPAPHPQHRAQTNTGALSQLTQRVSLSQKLPPPTLWPFTHITALSRAFLPFTRVNNHSLFFFLLLFSLSADTTTSSLTQQERKITLSTCP